MYKIILAIALALACAMGGSHKGKVQHPSAQNTQDTTGGNVTGGDEGHTHP